jgi:hypothetical protein
MLFVNIPVADIERSKAFFAKLGFSYNPMFTDETAACMVVGEQAFVMLLSREKFGVFAKDYGFMYSRSFFDLDGHGWQVMWMDRRRRSRARGVRGLHAGRRRPVLTHRTDPAEISPTTSRLRNDGPDDRTDTRR